MRPEHILLRATADAGGENAFEAVVVEATYYGAISEIVLEVPGVSDRILTQNQNPDLSCGVPEVGMRMNVQFPKQNVFAVAE